MMMPMVMVENMVEMELMVLSMVMAEGVVVETETVVM